MIAQQQQLFQTTDLLKNDLIGFLCTLLIRLGQPLYSISDEPIENTLESTLKVLLQGYKECKVNLQEFYKILGYIDAIIASGGDDENGTWWGYRKYVAGLTNGILIATMQPIKQFQEG